MAGARPTAPGCLTSSFSGSVIRAKAAATLGAAPVIGDRFERHDLVAHEARIHASFSSNSGSVSKSHAMGASLSYGECSLVGSSVGVTGRHGTAIHVDALAGDRLPASLARSGHCPRPVHAVSSVSSFIASVAGHVQAVHRVGAE